MEVTFVTDVDGKTYYGDYGDDKVYLDEANVINGEYVINTANQEEYTQAEFINTDGEHIQIRWYFKPKDERQFPTFAQIVPEDFVTGTWEKAVYVKEVDGVGACKKIDVNDDDNDDAHNDNSTIYLQPINIEKFAEFDFQWLQEDLMLRFGILPYRDAMMDDIQIQDYVKVKTGRRRLPGLLTAGNMLDICQELSDD
ncbi:MAG: hypothetical protein LBN22_10885 [Clostridiales Family XIII bacterium]|jgi:hypothetical protein|nr:hypothetical protein [Clostridiales Family XIII bacterium]